jgi:hypothetical protein
MAKYLGARKQGLEWALIILDQKYIKMIERSHPFGEVCTFI